MRARLVDRSHAAVLLLFGGVLAGCHDRGTAPAVGLAPALNVSGLTVMSALIEQTGVIEELAEGPFTLFAPTDEAFAALPPGTLESLDDEALADLVRYHVVPSDVPEFFLPFLEEQTSLTGQKLYVSELPGGVHINGQLVLDGGLPAANGTAYAIDGVLTRPGPLVDLLDAAGYSTFITAAATAELFDDLATGFFTVLAPTDEAFEALPEGVLAGLLAPTGQEQLVELVEQHLVPGLWSFEPLEKAGDVPTLGGGLVVADTDPSGAPRINGSSVAAFDLGADNGVVHGLDAVLPVPVTIGEAVAPTLLGFALQAAELTETVSDPEASFTLFAPTEKAILNADPELLFFLASPKGQDALADVLSYHVVPGALTASEVLAATELATLLTGEALAVDVPEDEPPTVGGAGLVATNLVASNGLIHVVDALIVPPSVTPPETSELGKGTTTPDAVDAFVEAFRAAAIRSFAAGELGAGSVGGGAHAVRSAGPATHGLAGARGPFPPLLFPAAADLARWRGGSEAPELAWGELAGARLVERDDPGSYGVLGAPSTRGHVLAVFAHRPLADSFEAGAAGGVVPVGEGAWLSWVAWPAGELPQPGPLFELAGASGPLTVELATF